MIATNMIKKLFKNIIFGVLSFSLGFLFIPFSVEAARTGGQVLTGLFSSSTLSLSLTPPTISLGNSTTTGSVYAGTLYFQVDASDGVGRSMPSNQSGTSTVNQAHGWNITWTAIQGAASYRVYFSTSTPDAMYQYFTATTTSQYSFTSTSTPTYTTGPVTTNNAFVTQFNINGDSWVNGGKLGISTSTPWGQLSVNPSALGSGVPEFVVGSSSATHLVVTGEGNTGIGIIAPGAKLSLASDFANSKFLLFDNGSAYIGMGVQAGEFRFHVNSNSTDFRFYDAPAGNALVTFKGTGNVGIGSTTPWRTLGVTGTVGFDGLTGSSGLQVGILCLSANKEVINESVACVASNRIYKENIKPLTIGLDELLKLNPVSFTWKKDYLGNNASDPNQNGTQYSLIAQDVQKVDPNLVSVETQPVTFEGKTYPAGTLHGLADMNHWVALITQSIKDFYSQFQKLVVRVVGVEKRINNLEQKNKDLEKRLKVLEDKIK